MLAKLIQDGNWQQVLVFSRTKHGANRLARYLEEKKITALAIHGNKSQGARTKALANFKSGEVRVLVATDIAARGLDIPQLPQVVNFDLPNVSEDYVHRIGRTGRAGETGNAYSLVCADEAKELFAIERLIGKLLTRHELDGFTPVNAIPESKLDTRPMKPKKRRSLKNQSKINKKVIHRLERMLKIISLLRRVKRNRASLISSAITMVSNQRINHVSLDQIARVRINLNKIRYKSNENK
ncbi:ATP-dependent RNA helicase RhlE [Vibrio variabilis]|uniref:ATP-dependent RNA helicase RhlE n=1 Tax=Vibrio variabilis TaxID=990271 RepID=A0ABQ0J7A7_9VIBR|nr:ATP-dependent RNA helicase RhlE [Vibrio variabilis]